MMEAAHAEQARVSEQHSVARAQAASHNGIRHDLKLNDYINTQYYGSIGVGSPRQVRSRWSGVHSCCHKMSQWPVASEAVRCRPIGAGGQ